VSASDFTLCVFRPPRDGRLVTGILEGLLEKPSSSIARLEAEMALRNESGKCGSCSGALIERGGLQCVEIAKLSFNERHYAGNLITGAFGGELRG